MVSRFNDSELSKMDIGPLLAEIMDYITPVVVNKKADDDKNNGSNADPNHVKFALYSGHDSTVLPLMASLGAKIWNATNFPAFASMMLLEVSDIYYFYESKAPQNIFLKPTSFAHRT